jgi:DNA-binding CsgD family transcriptional regulator
MLLSRPTSLRVEDPTFSTLFEQSRVPMALVDRDRRYVDVNDAGLELFSYRREDVIGQLAGRTAVGDGGADGQWGRLLRTNELYGERTVLHPSGTPLRVGYAAHASTVNGQWLALIVTLSAHFEPDGVELIGTTPHVSTQPAGDHRPAAALTAREREVVRRVALGASTRQIAADLYLSPATVRSHVRNAMVKTNSHTRAQLVALVLADVLNRP